MDEEWAIIGRQSSAYQVEIHCQGLECNHIFIIVGDCMAKGTVTYEADWDRCLGKCGRRWYA